MSSTATSSSSSSSSLEGQIAQHRLTLTQLYNCISPLPIATSQVEQQIEILSNLLKTTIEAQRTTIERERDEIEADLKKKWDKVELWRNALGEDPSRGGAGRNSTSTSTAKRGQGPLKTLVEEVEVVLQGMRGRMEERGRQILNLNAKLNEFVQVFGNEWFQVSLDKVEDEEAQVDGKSWENLDLRLERMSALERELMRCETELNRRREVINANVNEIFALRSELGIHQGDGSTTTDEFDEAILSHLGVGEGREHRIELKPTTENIARAEAKRKWLEEEKNQRNVTIQTTYDKLYPLWTMLGVSEYEMEQFVNNHMGSTQDVVTGYQDELARMLTLKRSNLSAFIQRERIALSNLWDSLYLSMPQRIASFPPLQISIDSTRIWNEALGYEEEVINNNVSEELLIAHERERERIELEVERCRPVLERLGKYFSVVEEMAQLEASASDPSRLLGKTTRGDPGRLLREEKARKRVVKEKPKLEAELRQFIPAWEMENQRPFLVNGVRFLDDLENKMGKEMAEKETKKREKLGTKATTSSTHTRPLQAQMTGASLIHGPIKRQMTGRSTGGASTSAPSAKRQTPMMTGASSASRGVLADNHSVHQQQHQQEPMQQGYQAHPMVVGVPTKLVPQPTGMKIPSGWGAAPPATASLATSHIDSYGYHQQAPPPPHQSQYGNQNQVQYSIQPIRAQATGGFRPGPR